MIKHFNWCRDDENGSLSCTLDTSPQASMRLELLPPPIMNGGGDGRPRLQANWSVQNYEGMLVAGRVTAFAIDELMDQVRSNVERAIVQIKEWETKQ